MKFLYDHQKEIIIDDPKKTGLFLGTGSGKTRTALMLAQGKTLVIAPKTQVEDKNWQRELGVIKKELDLTVISKETFRRDWESLDRFDTVIVDEAHTCLGVTPNIRWFKRQPYPKTSQLFEALDRYITGKKPERLYLCTATIIKSPMTVWGASKILGYNINWNEFRDQFYFKLPMPGREVFTPKNDAESKNRLAEIVRQIGYTGQLSDYFDVPDQTYKTIHIELMPKQKERIKDLPLEFPDPLVLLGKKHQVENGVLAGDEFNDPEFFSNKKIDVLLDLAVEFPRMIVFAKYSAQILQIEAEMKAIGKKTFVLAGQTSDRGKLIAEACTWGDYVFICQSQISAGWELPECPVMVFASMSYSVVDRIQAEGRIQRANNIKKNLYIDLVVKGGIDEAVQKSIANKKDFDARIYLEQNEKRSTRSTNKSS